VLANLVPIFTMLSHRLYFCLVLALVVAGCTSIASVGITIRCGSSTVLYSKQSETETKYDLPWGDTAAHVQAKAIRLSEQNAKASVEEDLNRQLALINCPTGCTKIIGIISTQIVAPGGITSSSTGGTVYDSYTATATAERSVTAQCTAAGGG